MLAVVGVPQPPITFVATTPLAPITAPSDVGGTGTQGTAIALKILRIRSVISMTISTTLTVFEMTIAGTIEFSFLG